MYMLGHYNARVELGYLLTFKFYFRGYITPLRSQYSLLLEHKVGLRLLQRVQKRQHVKYVDVSEP